MRHAPFGRKYEVRRKKEKVGGALREGGGGVWEEKRGGERVRGDKGLQHSSREPDAGARLGNRTSQGGREIMENVGFSLGFRVSGASRGRDAPEHPEGYPAVGRMAWAAGRRGTMAERFGAYESSGRFSRSRAPTR